MRQAMNSAFHQKPTSVERTALELLDKVAFIEWKRIGRDQEYRSPTDRKWLLDAYAECLEAAKGMRDQKDSFSAIPEERLPAKDGLDRQIEPKSFARSSTRTAEAGVRGGNG